MTRSLKELAEFVAGRVVGENVEVSGISSPGLASPGDLVFVEEEKHLEAAFNCPASAVVAGEFAVGGVASKPLLIVPQPRLAFARAAQLLYPAPICLPEFMRAPLFIRPRGWAKRSALPSRP